MKRYISLFLFATLLVACSSPAVTSTSIPPTLTATLLPPTETLIPTATSTPTDTPDPNMPADATGKDAQGNYIKVENGVTYTWMQFPLGNTGGIYKGWFEIAHEEWTNRFNGIWRWDKRRYSIEF